MGQLDDIIAFVRVVDMGGFTRAAERLGISKSIVSRRVVSLEDSLGARLLNRTTRGVSPTEAGTLFKTRCDHILAELEAAREAVAEHDGELTGTLRLAAPLSFGISHLARAISAFAAQHQKLAVDLSFSDRLVDLVANGFDAAVRIGVMDDSTLISRKLATIEHVLVASPAYVQRYGEPHKPADLTAHHCLGYSGATSGETWRFRTGRRWTTVRIAARYRADNGEVLREAVLAGLGISALPDFLAAEALARQELVRLLPAYPMLERGLYLIRPPGGSGGAKIRALTSHLASWFETYPQPLAA